MPTLYLEDLRKEAGFSPTEALRAVAAIAPDVAPKHRSGIVHWEDQGILDFRVITALATIYKKPELAVRSASLASRERFRQKQKQKVSK